MDLSEAQIEQIVKGVLQKLKASAPPAPAPESASGPAAVVSGVVDGVFEETEEAIAAAAAAQKTFMAMPLAIRRAAIQAIREVGAQNSQTYAELELEGAQLGSVEGTLLKMGCAVSSPGLEDLAPEVFVGDKGVTIIERLPVGVVASINPVTIAAGAIYMNSIMILAGGNAVVHNPHPKTVPVSAMAVRDINQAVVGVGGPPNLVCMMSQPTVASAQFLMTHPKVRMIAVMGGQGVINFATKTGKRCLAGGPGNTPVVVDETADIPKAAKNITDGNYFAYGTPCACEKEVFVVESVADQLIAEMRKNGAFLLTAEQGQELLPHIFKEIKEPGTASVINMDYIGKPISFILNAIGVDPGPEARIAILETDNLHPLVWTEQIMSVVPIVRCRNADEAIDRAVAAEQGFRHTLVMHSKNVDNLAKMASKADVCEFVKNGPSTAGIGVHGEGYQSMHIVTGGEGHARPRNYTLIRRCILTDEFRYRYGAA
ncbi:MAG: aldehyde dehydrogenase [Deltaproteobacteria bacterium]|nr:aldehyde dehydrogenase [Deltaproteobacteria bacterium]